MNPVQAVLALGAPLAQYMQAVAEVALPILRCALATSPEITRWNLSSSVLRAAALGAGLRRVRCRSWTR